MLITLFLQFTFYFLKLDNLIEMNLFLMDKFLQLACRKDINTHLFKNFKRTLAFINVLYKVSLIQQTN